MMPKVHCIFYDTISSVIVDTIKTKEIYTNFVV